ncbi:MAG TPA: hypothetical protein PKC72_15360 [Chitinophagaceae bacterium]|nr:hypothetical protein [Chitinophagaceae bacterium]
MSPKYFTLVLYTSVIIFCNNLSAQVAAVKFSVKVPGAIENGKSVFIAGSFNYWHAGDSLYRMQQTGDDIYSILLPLFENVEYKYKYTLGNWDRVEVAMNDSDITNRQFLAVNNASINDIVQKWKQPQKAGDKPISPQLKQINDLKDSATAKMQLKLNEMIGLLKPFIANLLQENPDKRTFDKLNKKAGKKLNEIYLGVAQLFWDVFAALTPEQKKNIRDLIENKDSKEDYINRMMKAIETTVDNNK